jgi:hypothetical protein
MTDLDIYQPAAGIVMTPEDAKALDDQVRACTRAVLREGTDYGHIPGTSGDEKSLWRPGAQKLLQWFRLECACDRIDLERDDDGRKHGITYRAEVGRGLKTATPVILATCEGTADYDESKFYQTAEEVQRKAETKERNWARDDNRPPRPTRWQGLPEYRADWNALMKRAQKRAIVGAVIDATAAGGIFSDREEDDTPAPGDGDPGWYEQALERALTFTTPQEGNGLLSEAEQAKDDRRASRGHAAHVQNRVRQRMAKLRTARPVDVEDLARQAAPAEDEPDYDTPGTATTPQITAIWTILSTVFTFTKDEKDQARAVCSRITERTLGSTKNLSRNEAKTVLDTLASWRKTAEDNDVKPREFLIELMATAGNGNGDD